MNGDLSSVFLLSLLAMFNPTLLAAVTVMMLLPNTKRLMLGYLLGAYTTSITLGLAIVFSLNGSGAVETARNTLSPSEDIVLGTPVAAGRVRAGHRARRAAAGATAPSQGGEGKLR